MTNVTPIYDVWLREYEAEREVAFSIDFEQPELNNMGSRDVLLYAQMCGDMALNYVSQAVECVLAGDRLNCINENELGIEMLWTSVGAYYMGGYYYDEMHEAIATLADRDFMMNPETAGWFMYVMRVWGEATGNRQTARDPEEGFDDE